MLAHVQALAGEIGTRGTGTPGEAAAADYVCTQLASLKLPVERRSFRAVSSQNAFPVAVNLLGLLAVVVYPLGGALTRWIGAALALSTPVLLWQTITNSNNVLRPFLPQVSSSHVIAKIEPRGAVRQRAVLLAHLDTNRCRFVWRTGMVRSLVPLTYLYFGVLAFLGLLYLAGALFNGPAWLWRVSLLPAAYLVGTIVTLWRDDRTPFSPGAHDNAASVAVSLELARRLVAQPLANTQVWLAYTGAEETDHAGLTTLLREHGAALRQAAFVDMEGVGGGEIVYLTRQGLVFPYRPDPALVAAAERAASRLPESGIRPAQVTIEDEVRALREAGFRAICIAGIDPETGALPHWHRADDTADTVSPEALERALKFVLALLEDLDRGQFDPAV